MHDQGSAPYILQKRLLGKRMLAVFPPGNIAIPKIVKPGSHCTKSRCFNIVTSASSRHLVSKLTEPINKLVLKKHSLWPIIV